MNPDNQIQVYEDKIARLEEYMRAGSGDPSQLNREIEFAYQQLALLKIRQFMNLAS